MYAHYKMCYNHLNILIANILLLKITGKYWCISAGKRHISVEQRGIGQCQPCVMRPPATDG